MSPVERRITLALLFSNLDGAIFVFTYLDVPVAAGDARARAGRSDRRRRALRRLRARWRSRCAAGSASGPRSAHIGWLERGRDGRPTTSGRARCACRSCWPASPSRPGSWRPCSSPLASIPFGHELSHFVKLGGHASSSAGSSAARSPSCSSSAPCARCSRRRWPTATSIARWRSACDPACVLSWALGSGIVLLSLAVLPFSARRPGVSERHRWRGGGAGAGRAGRRACSITVSRARAVADPLDGDPQRRSTACAPAISTSWCRSTTAARSACCRAA